MSKQRKSQPVSSAPSILQNGEVTLRLEPDARLNVTVLPTPKAEEPLNRPLKLLRASFVFLLMIWMLLCWRYLPIENKALDVAKETGLDVSVAYPVYATFKDELELTIIVTNRSAEEFNGSVAVLFQNTPAYPLPAESAIAKLEKLPSGAAISHRLKFALKQPQWFSRQAIQTQLSVKKDDKAFPATNGPAIPVAWIPLSLRWLNQWLSNSAIVAAIATLLWEITRKRFFGLETKG